MGYKQQKSLCFLNFKEKRFVRSSNFIAKATNGDDSGSSSTYHARLKVGRGPEGEHFAAFSVWANVSGR